MLHNRGTTIVETLVYIAIFAVLGLACMNTLVSLTRIFSETRINRTLAQSGFSALDHMEREIHSASSIDATGSTLNVHPGVLTLNTTDASGNPKTVKFAVDAGVIKLYENGTLTGKITGDNVTVTNLVFNSITTASSTAVKVSLTVQDNNSVTGRHESFYTTAVLRGGYAE